MRRFRSLACILVVAGCAECLCLGALPPGPLIEGRPLREWLESYDIFNGPAPQRQKAMDAVHRAGTNAIPVLLALLEADDSSLNFKGTEGFGSLQAEAKDAVPALIRILDQGVSPSSQYRTAQALAYLGPAAKAAVPALLSGTTNSDATVRSCSITTLALIQAEPGLVLPVFTRSLSDPDPHVEGTAAFALGLLGAEARSAIPALVEWRRTETSGFQDGIATLALKRIAPEEFSGEAELWPFGPPGSPGDGADSARVKRGWSTDEMALSRFAWGPPAPNGLRAACYFVPAQEAYADGDVFKRWVVFHNGGAEPLFFGLRRGGDDDTVVVSDDHGRTVPAGHVVYTTIWGTELFHLEPGQIVETERFYSTGIGWSIEGSAPLSTIIKAAPGTVCRLSWSIFLRMPGTNVVLKTGEERITMIAKRTGAPER